MTASPLKIRKIILLSAIAVLAVVLVFQQVFSGPVSAKEYTLDTSADRVELQRPAGNSLVLVKRGDVWFSEAENIELDSYLVSSIVDQLSTIKSLGLVSRGGDLDRFSLDEATRTTARLYADGKLLRTVYIGKNAAAESQTYIQLDDSKDILIVSGSLRDPVEQDVEALKKKEEPVSAQTDGGAISSEDATSASVAP